MSDAALIEQIVSRVMERLRAGETSARGDDRTAPGPDPARRATTSDESTIDVDETVITAEILEKQARGGRRVRIGPRSILTPTAHDFLRTHRMAWSRRSDDANPAATSPVRWRALVAAASPATDAALGDQPAARWDRQLSGGWQEAADAAVSAVCRGEIDGAVVFCRETAAAACRANRNSKVRAAAANSAADVQGIRCTLAANVYCIDPEGRNAFELRNLLREIASSSPRVSAERKD